MQAEKNETEATSTWSGQRDENKWKVLTVTPDDKLPAPLYESKFKLKFPGYREQYLRAAWPKIEEVLQKFGIKGTLNLVDGELEVVTTRKTWDPFAIINARDFVNLLARSVPLMQAVKIFNDDTFCDIVKLGKSRLNKNTYLKRRQRIIGPNGSTLKALELLTKCYILVQGDTAALMGPFRGMTEAHEIIRDCMQNVHPIYKIKELMIKRELQKKSQTG